MKSSVSRTTKDANLPSKKTVQDGKPEGTCLEQFQKYYEVRGGMTDSAKKSAQQHRRQVESLLERLHLTNLRQLVSPLIPMRIVETLQNSKMKPKTTLSYLLSLKKLCNFLQINREVANCLGIPASITTRTSSSAEDFSASLRPAAIQRELEIKSQIAGAILPSSTVRQFKESARTEMETTIRALQSSPQTVEWSRVARMRNILIAFILLSSGHRSGVITQMTLREFNQASDHISSGLVQHFIVKVHNHKTARTYRPVSVVLTEELHRWCVIYRDIARPLTPGNQENTDTGHFFVGRGSGAVKRVAQEISRLAVRHNTNKLTPLNIRKTVSNKSFETQSAHRRGVIAEHMAHKESTQAHYYRACQSDDMACEASTTITSLLDGTNSSLAEHSASNENLPGTSGQSSRQQPPRQQPSHQQPRPFTPPPLFDEDRDTNSGDDDNDDEDFVPPSSPEQCEEKCKRVRATFTLEEIHKIMDLYHKKKKSFSSKANIKSIVKIIYQENQWLKKWSFQQLYDKIRHTLNDE